MGLGNLVMFGCIVNVVFESGLLLIRIDVMNKVFSLGLLNVYMVGLDVGMVML